MISSSNMDFPRKLSRLTSNITLKSPPELYFYVEYLLFYLEYLSERVERVERSERVASCFDSVLAL